MTAYPLRALDGRLQKIERVETTEIETDEGSTKGMFVFRDEDGEKWMWSPHPYRYQWLPVETVAEADQVAFLCPLCFERNGGAVGTHGCHVTFEGRGVPDEAGSVGSDGKPTRWNASGTSIDDLVLTPSIQLLGGCGWHGFVGSAGIPPGHAG